MSDGGVDTTLILPSLIVGLSLGIEAIEDGGTTAAGGVTGTFGTTLADLTTL